MTKANIVIGGCGILGLTIARELIARGHDDILILEKESYVGKHASGRNSGVLHAGIYYTPGSARAKSCLDGNMLMRAYCKENNLPLVESGKVIVASTPGQVKTLLELHNRALRNGAKVDLVDEEELAEIEPNAKTVSKALYSYYTAVVDPKKILDCLYKEIAASGKAKVMFDCKIEGVAGKRELATNNGRVSFERLINVAGAHSDRLAHAFGLGRNYKLIPFKGLYRRLKNEHAGLVRGNIYPVPNIKNPFLGVHFTKSVYGDVYLGPTAIPAFGRENYGIIKGIDRESLEIIFRDLALFIQNKKFRDIALEEPRKYIFKYFFEDAGKLVRHLEPDHIMSSNKVGIRPQLIDLVKKELVMDFLIDCNEDSVHILNAISPAFTSSMAFAKQIVDEYIEH